MDQPFLSQDRSRHRGAHSFAHPLHHVSRELDAAVERIVERLALGPGDRLLDFGCADAPYRRLLPHGVEYLGADIEGNEEASVRVLADGSIDLDTHSVSAVLSTQVLEHVLEPAQYLAEARRVLNPTGRLGLSTHGLMRLHRDPIDLWRWTSDGLRHQLDSAGFEVLDFWGLVGSAATGIQLFQDATARSLRRPLRRPFVAALQALARAVDRRQSQDAKDLDAMVYAVIARPR